jgi:hypothetical protein
MHNGETGPVTRDERGRWLPGIKQAPGPGRPPASRPGYRDWMDALREALPAEKWAKALAKKVEEGDIRAIEYAGNRLYGFPRQQVDGLQAGNAASAAILQVMIDGRLVEDENAQRAAARAMFERFRHRAQLPASGAGKR